MNTLASDVKQFALLLEQNVEALWRSKAWAVVQGRGEAGEQGLREKSQEKASKSDENM